MRANLLIINDLFLWRRIHSLAPASGGKGAIPPVIGGNERSPPLAGAGGGKTKLFHNILIITLLYILTERICPFGYDFETPSGMIFPPLKWWENRVSAHRFNGGKFERRDGPPKL